MSGTSNVGQASVYEDGDQKNVPKSELEQEKKDARFHEGQKHSHKALDSSECRRVLRQKLAADVVPIEDERSIANKLAREEKVRRPVCTEPEGNDRRRTG